MSCLAKRISPSVLGSIGQPFEKAFAAWKATVLFVVSAANDWSSLCRKHQELASRGSRSLLLNQVTFNELWQVAMALEPLAAACAATLVTDENLTVLDANLEQTRKTIAAGESPIELDVKFHALVADIAGNKALLLAREPFALLLYPSFAEMRPHAPLADSRLLAAHAQIVAALKRRDGDEASAWMNRHIANFGRGWRLAGLDFDMPIVSADREELDTSLDG
jgi:GntR family transcriptional repressor for pyruvate dehydrogenase complex